MSEKSEATIAELVGRAVLLISSLPAGIAVSVYAAFVMGRAWGWFLVPLGWSEPPSLAMLTGLLLMIRWLVSHLARRSMTPEEKKYEIKGWLRSFVWAAAISIQWGILYLVHLAVVAGY